MGTILITRLSDSMASFIPVYLLDFKLFPTGSRLGVSNLAVSGPLLFQCLILNSNFYFPFRHIFRRQAHYFTH